MSDAGWDLYGMHEVEKKDGIYFDCIFMRPKPEEDKKDFDDVVKRAIKEKIIENDDVAKIAAAGFEKQASKIYKNISKTKSLTVFTLTVRFLVTVLMTPVIGKVVAMVNKKLGRGKYKK